MPEGLLAGLDVGTSRVAACAFTPKGEGVAEASVPLITCLPAKGWAEQDPLTWLAAAVEALRQLGRRLNYLGFGASRIMALGLTGGCPSFTLVNDNGRPRTAGLLHADNRATAEAARMAELLGGDAVQERAGLAPSPFCVAPKVMWLAAHDPILWRRRPWLAQARDLVALGLTGRLVTDETHAGGTGLYGLRARAWAYDWLETLDLGWLRLPEVVPAATVVGQLTSHAAATTGLRAGLPVVAGGADNFSADVAMGALEPGIVGDTSGMSTCLDVTTDRFATAAPISLFPHFRPGWYFANTGLNATGAAVAWAAKLLAGGDVARLEALAVSAMPDPSAPLFLPHLAGGERFSAGTAGAWYNLDLAHDASQLARSVYEGITFALTELLVVFLATGYPLTEVRLSGGGSRSAFWNGLKAEVWGVQVRANTHRNASALGAALLAGIAVGQYRGLEEAVAQVVQLDAPHRPERHNVETYRHLRNRWRALARREGALPLGSQLARDKGIRGRDPRSSLEP